MNTQPLPAGARIALNENEMASAIGVSVYWLQKDRQSRRIVPFYRIGGNIRYNPARVAEVLANLEEGGADKPRTTPIRQRAARVEQRAAL